MSTQRGSTWSREETEELIAVWGEESIQAQLEGARHNHKIFEQISSTLHEKGYIKRDGKQCQEKIKKLKKRYREILDNNNRSGKARKTWEFFHSMNEILGNRPMSRPGILMESSQFTLTPTPSTSTSTSGSQSPGSSSLPSGDELEDALSSCFEKELDENSLDASKDEQASPLHRKRKTDSDSPCANTKPVKKPKKSKAEKVIETATSSFLNTIKEADAQFFKAEEVRQTSEENRFREMLQLQRDMETNRLLMQERLQNQNREHEMRMMQMFAQILNQQPMQQPSYTCIPTKNHTRPTSDDSAGTQIPPFSEYGQYGNL